MGIWLLTLHAGYAGYQLSAIDKESAVDLNAWAPIALALVVFIWGKRWN